MKTLPRYIFVVSLVALSSFVAQAAAPTAMLKIKLQGTGTGTFAYTPKPLSLSCTAMECAATFKAKTKVGTTVRAAKNSIFKGWSGLCKGIKMCTLTLKGETMVTATFVGTGASAKPKNTTAPAPAPAPETKPQAAPVQKPLPPEAVAMNIQSMAFEKSSVTVSLGTTVTWTNRDSAPHTVTSNDGSFGSGTLSNGQSFSFTFTKAGTYAYICAIHPSMTATITVK